MHTSAKNAKPTSVRPLGATVYEPDEMTNVPVPVPETGIPLPSADTLYLMPPLITASPSVAQSTSVTSFSTFIPLPSFFSAEQSPTAGDVHAVGITAVLSPVTSAPPAHVQSFASSHRISRTATIAYSVVGGVILLAIFIAVMISRRPRSRRKYPTRSLPVLRNTAFPGQFESQGSESPIFGGKERFSPSLRGTRGNMELWTWSQYHSSLRNPVPTYTVTKSTSGESVKRSGSQKNLFAQKRTAFAGQDQFHFTGHGNFGQRTRASPQPAPNAAIHTASRLSTISSSYHSNSLTDTGCGAMNVGVAIDGTAPLRGDGEPMKLATGCGGEDTIAPPDAKDSSVQNDRSLADGRITSLHGSGRRPLNGGRVRIESTYYTPGSYPRISAACSARPKDCGQHDIFHPDVQVTLDLQRPASCLGLVSSVLPSHLALYAEDSMDTIGESRKVVMTCMRSQKKPVPKAIINYDNMSSDAAGGSLRTVDFVASKTAASLVNIRPREAGEQTRVPQSGSSPMGSVQRKTNMRQQMKDNPPRVPSPPPLPSLAHKNPEAHNDYHSPTYSIYGLYGGDRISRGT
ncbi:hypothetical protein M405DRAFT_844106 [Rhizopogon salebrosus TDB-379]|nr:hypothetical protein M405DRAFT_844106 [Rhizopogon salebrosus TDB-379]